MGETFARGWRVEAQGASCPASPHVRVNGYANGWRLPRGTYELTITYGPERLARSAGRFDLVLIPLVALCGSAGPSRAGTVYGRKTYALGKRLLGNERSRS